MSGWNSETAREFITLMRDIATKVFKTKTEQESVVFACLAVVISATEGSYEVTVRLLNSPDDGSEDFISRNQSGESLIAGDTVWLHYWGNLTNSYIAIRNWGG